MVEPQRIGQGPDIGQQGHHLVQQAEGTASEETWSGVTRRCQEFDPPNRRPSSTADPRRVARHGDETDDEEFWSMDDPERDRDRGRICMWCLGSIELSQSAVNCDVCDAGPFHVVHYRRHRRLEHGSSVP